MQALSTARTTSIYGGMLRGTGIYAIAMLISKMASFVMLPLYTRYLSPADYGVLELLSLAGFVVSALVFMRIGDSLCYYYSNSATPAEREEALCTVFLVTLVLGCLAAAAGWVGASWMSMLIFQTPRYALCVKLVFVALGLSFPVELGYSYLRLVNKTGTYLFASVGNLLFAIVANVVLLVPFHLAMYAMLWSSVFAAVLTAAAMTVGILRGINIRTRFKRSLVRHFITFSLPLGGSGLGVFVLNFGDRFFLQRNVSLTEVGIYALAYKFGMLVSYVQAPFETYWRAQMFDIARGPSGERIYIQVVSYVTAVLSFVTLLFILFTKPALAVLVSSDFQKAATYVPWIAAAYVIRAVASQFRCIFVLEGQTRNELWVALIGGGVCLAGYAFLIPRFHLWGAVASTLLGFSLMLVFALRLGQRIRHFDFEYRRIGIVLAVTFALALPVWIFHPHQWLAQIALGCVLASAYPVALRAAGFFYPSELAALKTQLSLVRARLAKWRSQPEAEPVAAGVAE